MWIYALTPLPFLSIALLVYDFVTFFKVRIVLISFSKLNQLNEKEPNLQRRVLQLQVLDISANIEL